MLPLLLILLLLLLYYAPAMFPIFLYLEPILVMPSDSNMYNKYSFNMAFPYLLGFPKILLGHKV